jgi:hypothetical protein
MQRTTIILIAALISLLLLTACSTLPLNGSLPDGLIVEKIVAVDRGSAFALSPDTRLVAMVRKGLNLLHIPSKEYIPLDKRAPLKQAWSPLGHSLAAIYATGNGSSIVIYDQHGTAIAEAPVDVRLTDLGWLSEEELVVGGVRIKTYKFGSNYQSLYFRWKPGQNMPVENRLRDTTLQSSTVAQWKALLQRGPLLDLTPQSGALLYLQPVDPPLFTPYYKLIINDLASGKELEVASVSLNSDGGRFSADGERILYADGSGTTLLYNPWTEETLRKTNSSGRNPALSPEGENWIVDGMLFRKNGAVIPLAEDAGAQFSPDGSKALIGVGGDLYLLTGLKPAEGTLFVPAIAEKIARLRSMRVQGLVTPKEYLENLQKLNAL